MQIQRLCEQQTYQLDSEIQRLRQYKFDALPDENVYEIATLVFQQMSAVASLRKAIGTPSLDEASASIISFQDAESPYTSSTPVVLQNLSSFPQGKEALLRIAKTVFCMIHGNPKVLHYAPPYYVHPDQRVQLFPSINEISRFIPLFAAQPLKRALNGYALEEGSLHGFLSNLWEINQNDGRSHPKRPVTASDTERVTFRR